MCIYVFLKLDPIPEVIHYVDEQIGLLLKTPSTSKLMENKINFQYIYHTALWTS